MAAQREPAGGRAGANLKVSTYFWIAVGGAFGSVARYGASSLIAAWVGETFPWGTLIVNVTGSFVIGLFAAVTGPDGRILVAPVVRQFVMVGICGGYTTFSSFSLQTLNLFREGQFLAAGANILLSVSLCLIAVWLGYVAGGALSAARAS